MIANHLNIMIKNISKGTLKEVKGKRLNIILSELKLPKDEASLRTILRHRRELESRLEQLREKLDNYKHASI
ncbi:MAG: hypothetical protein ACE5Z5_05910 [Candidatus Bathyarchaeia archaeon]